MNLPSVVKCHHTLLWLGAKVVYWFWLYRVQAIITSVLPYGPEWKHQRKLIQSYIGTVSALRKIEDLEMMEARRFLLKILEQPTSFVQHIRACVCIDTINVKETKLGQLSDLLEQLLCGSLMGILSREKALILLSNWRRMRWTERSCRQ